jgi:hypothetical protein
MESGFEQMRILGERLQALTEVVQQRVVVDGFRV